jgi:hypothetical protein
MNSSPLKSLLDIPKDRLVAPEELNRQALGVAILQDLSPAPPAWLDAEQAEVLGPPVEAAFEKAQMAGLGISLPMGMLVLTLSGDKPAKAVLWVWTLAIAAHRKGRDHLSAMDFQRHFHTGIPSDEDCREIWLAQKGPTQGIEVDNLLDLPQTWELMRDQERKAP